jgi:hypothetical protein
MPVALATAVSVSHSFSAPVTPQRGRPRPAAPSVSATPPATTATAATPTLPPREFAALLAAGADDTVGSAGVATADPLADGVLRDRDSDGAGPATRLTALLTPPRRGRVSASPLFSPFGDEYPPNIDESLVAAAALPGRPGADAEASRSPGLRPGHGHDLPSRRAPGPVVTATAATAWDDSLLAAGDVSALSDVVLRDLNDVDEPL